jgi:hypothetical protein
MRRKACIFIFVVSLVLSLGVESPVPAQNPGAGVGFRNDTKVAVIVQGWTVVNNMPRRGQALLINPGKTVWDNNLPSGTRYFSIYDASQPTRVYLRDSPVSVRNADQFFGIRTNQGNAQRMSLNAEPVP